MPNSAQNIKFYYGDSSSVYPPQSIDTNGLYLIKNKGVYAGSETIIDTSLFPFNNENTFVAHLYIDNDQTAPTSGTTKIYEDPSALIDAAENNKTIIGVLDRTTLSRHQHYMDGRYTVGSQIVLLSSDGTKPDGILLARYYKNSELIQEGGGESASYIFQFYDNYSIHKISYNKTIDTGAVTQTLGTSAFGVQWADIEHDHNYNSVFLSGNAGDTATAVVRTAAATQAKVVSITGWDYKHGNILQVRFRYGNTAANPTLNVNSGGAYSIIYGKTALTNTTLIKPDDCVTLIYYESNTTKYWYILSIDHAAERVKTVNDDASVAYLTGTTVDGINSLVYDSSVYLTTTPGELRATSFNENGVLLADKYVDVFVTFTVNASNGTVTADKTYTDLETAWTAKKLIVGKIVSSGTNSGVWGDQALDTIKPNLLSCTYGDYKGDPAFFFCNITATSDTVMSLDLRYEYDGTISVVDQATKKISLEGHQHTTLTHASANTTKLYITGVTGTSNQQPKYDTNVYLETTAGYLHATQFNGALNGSITSSTTATTQSAGDNSTKVATTEFVTTAISNASPALKYTVKNASSNAVSFTSTSSSTKMQPNTVYIVGSLSGTSFTWQKLNTLSIGNSSLDGDLGVLWNTGVNSQLPNTSASIGSFSADKTVSTYQILWVAGTNGTSITLPSSVKWKDGVAPDSRDMVNKLCELTIMNGLATINIS